jgi:Spy/CpxP family protein refolding chaperone
VSRIKTFATLVMPSVLAGGLLFHSVFGQAQPTTTPTPPTPPTAPTPRTPPTPPVPPNLPSGVSVSINNGKVQVTGIDKMVRQQIDNARKSIKDNTSIPKDVRDKVLARLDKVSAVIDKKLAKLAKGADFDDLEAEMEEMGKEIEEAMEGLEDEMEDLAEKYGKDVAKQLGNIDIDIDLDDLVDLDNMFGDDLDTIPMSPDLADDDNDMRDAITDLKDLALDKAQRDQITKIRTDSDKEVATAKTKLDDLSKKLETALGDPKTSDADISKYVDQISAQEAAVRKARLLGWHKARRVLSTAQQKQVQDAAKKTKKKP